VESSLDSVEIPNRAVFRAAEVCELAAVPSYVLRGWEAEFPDLGVSKSGGPRVYRRSDVERVLRLKHLILNDGLTLAGARKVMTEEGATAPVAEDVEDSDVAAMMDGAVLAELRDVKDGLEWILNVLGGHTANGDFQLKVQRMSAAPAKKAPPSKKAVAKGKMKAPVKKNKPAKNKGRKK
jgi:DNA-binding transcriptional MerR regulator